MFFEFILIKMFFEFILIIGFCYFIYKICWFLWEIYKIEKK